MAEDTATTTTTTPQATTVTQTPMNRWRRSDKWMLGIGSGTLGIGIAFVLQMNGLYFTRHEGLNVKEDLSSLALKVDANKTDVINAINLLRIDVNKNFTDMMLQYTRDQSAQYRTDEKQNMEIGEIKLLLPKPKTTKEN